MSENGSNEQVPVTPVGYPQQGYPSPYALQPVKPPAPPLTTRQRRGALIAGGVGFTLVQLGLLCFTLLTMFAIFALIAGFIVAVSGGGNEGVNLFSSGLGQFDPVVIGVVVAVVIVVGVLAVLFGILASRRILKSHGVNRPTAVTWSALGIGIAASWLLGGVGGFGSRFIGSTDNHLADMIMPWIIGALGVLGVLSSVAIGVFAWWWMAHVFRSRASVDRAPDDRAPDDRAHVDQAAVGPAPVGPAAVGPAGQ